MVDAVIVLIVLVLLFFALKGSVRHFKGESSCCSGASAPVRTGEKRLDGPVISVRTAKVDGMHCDACADRVKRAIDSIDGAAGAVDLKSGVATIRLDRSVDDIIIRKKIEEAGYKVVSIS